MGDQHTGQPVIARLTAPAMALDETDSSDALDPSSGGELAVCHPYAVAPVVAPVVAHYVHGMSPTMSLATALQSDFGAGATIRRCAAPEGGGLLPRDNTGSRRCERIPAFRVYPTKTHPSTLPASHSGWISGLETNSKAGSRGK